MKKEAEFSPCGKYRYYLSRIWDTQLPLAMCIGLNPSTANSEEDDPTIRNLTELLKNNGYGGFYMMNLYALISSKPEVLYHVSDNLKDNDYWLVKIAPICQDVIFCWGSFKNISARVKKVQQIIPNIIPKCFGKSKKGNPIHPLAATVWMKKKCKIQQY